MGARVYLCLSYVLGAGALAWHLATARHLPSAGDWLLGGALALLAAAAQIFVVKRARGNHSDHLTPAPLFAAFLLLPQPVLGLAICVAFLPEWVYYRRKWFIQSFNIASWLIASALGKGMLLLLTGHFRMSPDSPLPALAIVQVMPVFLGVQTLLLAWALKLARGHSLRESELFAPNKLFVEVALLCSGWSFAIAWVADPLYGIGAAVPLALIFQALHVPNLKEEAATDPKTGLANMRHFNLMLARELERTERSGQSTSLLMCDLDYLRNINNTYGHQAGDVVLGGIADLIRRNIRACDVAGRFGGEEFVILLADTGRDGAYQVAERLRQELEAFRFSLKPDGRSISATISIGVAAFPDDGRTPETLMREADLAVYQAKREGRNRVVVAGRESRELAAEWAREHLISAPAADSAAPGVPADTKLPFWRFIADATRLSVVTQEETAAVPAVSTASPASTAPAGGQQPRRRRGDASQGATADRRIA
ncbi:MAG: GGDEF domain-containing protein, partial [Chloroflexota bacterium]